MSRRITEFPCEYDCWRLFLSCTFWICQLQCSLCHSLAAALPQPCRRICRNPALLEYDVAFIGKKS